MGANRWLERRREFCCLEETLDFTIQFHQQQPGRARGQPEVGHVRRLNEFPERGPGNVAGFRVPRKRPDLANPVSFWAGAWLLFQAIELVATGAG